MSLVSEPGMLPKHAPSGGFVFDEEVSAIFDDMAHRSIPNYSTVHAMHTNMVMPRYHFNHFKGVPFNIMDVGASTGRLFDEICRHLHLNKTEKPNNMHGIAVDISRPMLDRLMDKVPWVECDNISIADPEVCNWRKNDIDVINMMYTLQFISMDERDQVIQNCFDMLKPGGILLLSQKEKVAEDSELFMERQYHSWRTMQGYSVEEIAMKTKALGDTMWVESQERTRDRCMNAGFSGFCETSRWLQFTSTVAFKPE